MWTRHVLLSAAFLGGLAISACNSGSEGTTLALPCVNGTCEVGYECLMDYCIPIGVGTSGGDGDGDSGDGDGDPSTGDGDGDPSTGDGDPSTGDGDPSTGDGDTADTEGCQAGTEGCACDSGACAPGLICDMDYLCAEEICGDGFLAADEDCEGNDLNGLVCEDLGDFDGGTLLCDPETCTYDTSQCNLDGCGDGNIDPGEQCDGLDLDGQSCMTLGYSGGQLLCDPIACTYDAGQCIL